MPYPTLPGRRFEYDIGGGSVYFGVKTNGTTSEAMVALTSEQMAGLNGIQKVSPVISIAAGFAQTKEITVWVFLPEQYVVAGLGMIHGLYEGNGVWSISVQGSANSTNGEDGTWMNATLPNGALRTTMTDDDGWRDSIQPCTFPEAIRVLKVIYVITGRATGDALCKVYALHVYGVKAVGQIPDDILFLDDDASGDPEFIRDLDFGDRPEGTTVTHRIKLLNSSTTKIANNLTLSLIDVDFTFSMDEGANWVTGATISSLAPQGTSGSILIKNTIPPPTQMLGPRAPRFEVTIGSWS